MYQLTINSSALWLLRTNCISVYKRVLFKTAILAFMFDIITVIIVINCEEKGVRVSLSLCLSVLSRKPPRKQDLNTVALQFCFEMREGRRCCSAPFIIVHILLAKSGIVIDILTCKNENESKYFNNLITLKLCDFKAPAAAAAASAAWGGKEDPIKLRRYSYLGRSKASGSGGMEGATKQYIKHFCFRTCHIYGESSKRSSNSHSVSQSVIHSSNGLAIIMITLGFVGFIFRKGRGRGHLSRIAYYLPPFVIWTASVQWRSTDHAAPAAADDDGGAVWYFDQWSVRSIHVESVTIMPFHLSEYLSIDLLNSYVSLSKDLL